MLCRTCELTSATAFILMAICVPTARAQTVDVPYQGWLTQGELPCDGTYSMVFSLYDDPAGGTAVWSYADTVSVTNGALSVVLQVDEAVVIASGALYLGIAVEGVDLMNRQRIYPSMYAARNMPGMEFWVDNLVRFPAQVGRKIVFYETSAGYWAIEIQPYTLALYTQAPTDPPTMVFKNTGYVGIGTEQPQKELHLVGDMQIDGNLSVQGKVNWTCPVGTIRIGTTCISSEDTSSYDWAEANTSCHNRGMELCSLRQLMMCIYSQLSEVEAIDQCKGAIIYEGHSVWTSDFDARDGTNLIFGAILVQVGSDGIYSYVRGMSGFGNADHFCCMPVSP